MTTVDELEVYADIACPFTHVGLRRFVAIREAKQEAGPRLRVRAWPLELVNGQPLAGSALAPKIEALRASVAPELFGGFDADRFVSSSLPALAAEAAAYRTGVEIGERFSLAVRTALFEEHMDVTDQAVLDQLRAAVGAARPNEADEEQVRADYASGRRRGVNGSPHFFTPNGHSYFCPSLDIGHVDGRIEVAFDGDGFTRFTNSVWPSGR
ncbi:MAG: DsbA family protein [Actinobacteria bacterium]|nr:DsbA family protein [Actinomycetota bacterium]